MAEPVRSEDPRDGEDQHHREHRHHDTEDDEAAVFLMMRRPESGEEGISGGMSAAAMSGVTRSG
jgi:hypothetical protein